MIDEIWKDITGLEGLYKVSNLGRIKSIKRNLVLIPQKIDKRGYLRVILKGKKFRVARLVAIHFIPNPLKLKEVNHKKGLKWDNRADELEWSSRKQNMIHAVQTGLLFHKLTFGEVNQIRKSSESQKQTADRFNISRQMVSLIKLGKRWSHLTQSHV